MRNSVRGYTKTNIPGWFKNKKTNVVVNNNREAWEIYQKTKTQLEYFKSLQETINIQNDIISKLEKDVEDFHREVEDIKSLLKDWDGKKP